MSSTKLFNFKFLKENLKKSKGLLILISIIVPLFTTLSMVLGYDDYVSRIVVTQADISIINILGMFLIPIAISFALFGYVFKKNSVDLIGSMPLKRNTIFITNTIGGIAIITIIQVVTAIALFLCSIFCKNVFIFPAMIWDIFLMMWIAYIFIFVASNIAMSISGTFWTQCAVTLLIIFLIPFCIVVFNKSFFNGTTLILTNNGRDILKFVNVTDYMSFTAPANLIFSILNGTIYSTESIIKSIILGIVYFIIGLKLFEKRKMENAEESFESDKVHLGIKALTMVPMIAIVHLINDIGEMSLILYALIIVYYFAYDFIVKKKIEFKYSLIALILIILCLEGICNVSDMIYDKMKLSEKRIDKSDIKAIAVDFGFNSVYGEGKPIVFTRNEELIDALFEIENQRDDEYQDKYEDVGVHMLSVKIKDEWNKEYEFYMNLNLDDMDKILAIVEKGYLDDIKYDYTREGIFRIDNIVIDDKELADAISEELNEKINSMNAKEYYGFKVNINTGVGKCMYVDHEIVDKTFPIDLTEKELKLIANYENQKTQEVMKYLKTEAEDEEQYYNLYVDSKIKGIDREDYYLEDGYYFSFYHDEVAKLIKDSKDVEFDATKDYYIIRGGKYVGFRNYPIYFFTNDIDKVNEIIERDIELSDKENAEYQQYEASKLLDDVKEESEEKINNGV